MRELKGDFSVDIKAGIRAFFAFLVILVLLILVGGLTPIVALGWLAVKLSDYLIAVSKKLLIFVKT